MLVVLGELVVDLIPVPARGRRTGGNGAHLRRPPGRQRAERGRRRGAAAAPRCA